MTSERNMDSNRSTVTREAPEFIVDIDGLPIGLRRDLAANSARAIRVIVEGHWDWLLDDVPAHWIDDETKLRYDRLTLLGWARSVKPGYMRPWNADEDDYDSEWGEDAWYWCSPDHPDAVEYWELPWA